jgi:iron(III)-enterobactin esterase
MNQTKLYSSHLKREVDIHLYTGHSTSYQQLIIINDGQDLAKMDLNRMLAQVVQEMKIPTLVIGCAAASGEERKQEYGVHWSADYKGRGAKARAYSQFITWELIDWVHKNFHFMSNPNYAIAGWSLGGLSAIDIAWHTPSIFQKVGVFSGSLWWRHPGLIQDDVHHRLMHHKIKHATEPPPLKFWFQAGTEDETADRNQNGIIDAIDDTLDLIQELERKGYQSGKDMHFHIEEGGRHDVETWAKVMPLFLEWAITA